MKPNPPSSYHHSKQDAAQLQVRSDDLDPVSALLRGRGASLSQRVLIVEDDAHLRAALLQNLVRDNLEVDAVGTCSEGLAQARRLQPDVIVLDVILPDGDGFELCRQIKSELDCRDPSIIFTTTKRTLEQKLIGFETGAVDYVTKPYSFLELRARVEATLRAKRALEDVSRQAWVDSMTGLWNHAALMNRLNVERARPGAESQPLGCVMLDIDHFKEVNDSHGHLVGDEALRHVAQLIRRSIRPTDFAARYGGDEMVILLPNTSVGNAANVAERIRTRVARCPVPALGDPVMITCSFGVTDSMVSGGDLIWAADGALYQSKRLGRNRVQSPACPALAVGADSKVKRVG